MFIVFEFRERKGKMYVLSLKELKDFLRNFVDMKYKVLLRRLERHILFMML